MRYRWNQGTRGSRSGSSPNGPAYGSGVEFHLAQVNIGRMAAPLDSAQMADFMNNLDPVNALAEASPGFVWRLQTDEGNATSISAFDDPLIIMNMSVWTDIESLRAYVYGSTHVEFLRRRAEFFTRMTEAFLALWWVPVGTIPTIEEAQERLDHLRTHGPTTHAFTLRQSFPPPD